VLKLVLSDGFMPMQRFGPAPLFELDRRYLRHGSQGQVIGRHINCAWEVGTRHYSCIQIDGRAVFAVFFDPGHPQGSRIIKGPFTQIRLVDGHAYGDGSRLAQFVESSDAWCEPAEEACWPCVEFRNDAR